MTARTELEVRKAITVAASKERAFAVYTEGMGTWWPREHHIGESDLVDVVFEPKQGGRIYERGVDGSECQWGTVLVWEPSDRVVYTWQLQGDWKFDPDPARASEIEMRFIAEGPKSTRVELVHSHFERHGDGADSVYNGVNDPNGWEYVLRLYAEGAAA